MRKYFFLTVQLKVQKKRDSNDNALTRRRQQWKDELLEHIQPAEQATILLSMGVQWNFADCWI